MLVVDRDAWRLRRRPAGSAAARRYGALLALLIALPAYATPAPTCVELPVQSPDFIHLFIYYKSTQQTCMHGYNRAVEKKHVHLNKNNKNTEKV